MTNALTNSGLFGGLMTDAELAEVFEAEQMLGHMLAFEAAWTRSLADLGAVEADVADGPIAGIAAAPPGLTGLAQGGGRGGRPAPGARPAPGRCPTVLGRATCMRVRPISGASPKRSVKPPSRAITASSRASKRSSAARLARTRALSMTS